MPVVEVYYQMTEKDTSTVNGFWKVVHIILFAIIVVSGFTTAYTFGNALEAFRDNCILYANVTFSVDNGTPSIISDDNGTITIYKQSTPPIFYDNGTITVHKQSISLRETIWGSAHTCCFSQFTPLMSAIFAIIWLVFFMMCAKGGAGYPADVMVKPWHLVYPASIFAIIFTIVLVASHFEMYQGLKVFCKQLGDIGCGKLINSYALASYKSTNDVSANVLISQYVGRISIIAWLTQIGILMARVFCIADFELHVVSITGKDEKEEQIAFPERELTVDDQNEQETSFVTN